jgi:rhodanese-related sulfurtransferase
MTRSVITAYWYAQMGFKHVQVLEGGINAWLENGRNLETKAPDNEPMNFRKALSRVDKIDAAGLNRRLRERAEINLLYVGDSRRFKNGHIPGSIWLLRSFLDQKIESTVSDRNLPIVVTCDDGRDSILGASTLLDLGYENIQVLDGGTEAWQSAGLSLVSGATGIIGQPDDIMPKSHERTRAQMLRYLDWEEKLYGDPVYMKVLGLAAGVPESDPSESENQ